jgi:hypothetical protein
MTERQGPDVPNRILDAAGKSQRLEKYFLGRLYLPLHAIVHGSNSPAYLKAQYEKAIEVVDENGHDTNLPIAEADPSPDKMSFLLQGRKKEAVVVGAGQAIMNSLLENNPGSQAAVAFTYGKREVTRAGILPNGVEDYGKYNDNYIAAMRVGGGAFGAGVAVWVPKERTIIAPRNNFIVAEHLPIDELTEKYPGAPLP